jgi:ABC-2 type transport system ATP-binding protein
MKLVCLNVGNIFIFNPMNQAVIETENLTKFYRGRKGVENLNLRIRPGEIFGFLGPNGAGKSTTIRLILNLIYPSAGSVRIFGSEIRSAYHRIFREIGNVPGEFKLYEELTGRYFLEYMCALAGKPPVLLPELLQDFQVSPADLTRKIKYYSHGMKQKLAIIQAMQSAPRLLIMDEPSESLDPLNKNVLYEYIRKFKAEGKTIFFSSHYLPEVEKICDRVGLIRDGNMIAEEKISDLKKKMVRKMSVSFAENVDPQQLHFEGVTVQAQQRNDFILLVSGDLNPLFARLAKFRIHNLVFPEPSLEETFMTYYS